MAEILVSETVAINRYFGKLPGETNTQFLAELKALSLEDKHYLACGAAKELGLKQEQLQFKQDL